MIELRVEAMSCGHCVKVITSAVMALDPKAEVTTDLATKQVNIESTLPMSAFIRALGEEDYQAQPV
jgi:copper chaperone